MAVKKEISHESNTGYGERKTVEEALAQLPDGGEYLKNVCNIMKVVKVAVAFKRDKGFEISYLNEKNDFVSSKQLKEAMMNKSIYVVNLQIDAAGRMVKKAVNMKLVNRKYYGYGQLSAEEQYIKIIHGLALIDAMDEKKKKDLLAYIKGNMGIDAADISKLVTKTSKISFSWYGRLDTMCRDRIIYLMDRFSK